MSELTKAKLAYALAILQATEGKTIEDGAKPIAIKLPYEGPEPKVTYPEKNFKRLRNISRWRQ